MGVVVDIGVGVFDGLGVLGGGYLVDVVFVVIVIGLWGGEIEFFVGVLVNV